MSNSFAQNAPSVQEITKQIIQSVNEYANSISCHGTEVSPKDIATLTPYKTLQEDAEYAVLWAGDIGCAGGSGTTTSNIAIVHFASLVDSFIINPLLSSPVVDFESVIFAKLVGNTHNSLVLDGFEYASDDAMCCPSISVRVTVRVNKKGNWKIIKRKVKTLKKKY